MTRPHSQSGGVRATTWKLTAVRVGRSLAMVALGIVLMHTICAFANSYTTRKYVALAQSPARAAQYARPLYDAFFFGDREASCIPGMQTAYDLALWFLCFHTIRIGYRALVRDGKNGCFEHIIVIMLGHHVFMVAAQVVTTLPASGGIEECLAANPHGVDAWPWYGVSFMTQSFAGARACADMIYSGHIANMAIFAVAAQDYLVAAESSRAVHVLLSAVLGTVASAGIVLCQDHYSVDVVLGIGISLLLMTNPHLKALAEAWAHFNYSLERRFCHGPQELNADGPEQGKID